MTSADDLPPVPFASLPEPISALPDSNASISPSSSPSPAPPPPPSTVASSPIKSDSSGSRNRGVERIVGPANSVRKHSAELMKQYGLLEEPLASATRLIAMVVELWNRAIEEIVLDVIMWNESKAQIKSYHSRARSHLLYLIKEKVDCKTLSLYSKKFFLSFRECSSDYLDCSCKFLAPEIVDVIYAKYFNGMKMLGNKDPEFLERINPTLVCLVAAGIWHWLRAWHPGTYIKREDFTGSNESVMRTFTRMLNTWWNRRLSITFACRKIEVIPVQAFEEGEESLRKALEAFREASNHPLVSTRDQGQSVTPGNPMRSSEHNFKSRIGKQCQMRWKVMPSWKNR
ncbi:hypothetical protein Q9L58_009705 [Maublancomyces gigas]|uniref:DUF6532 domain-containing protein n=1 Tax=Discina gigas TaxID=1032678 RepID=A0ABR3G658_9PEZI